MSRVIGDRLLVIGSSPIFLRALWEAALVAGHKVSVLISGESGTGKELFSRVIHSLSDRRDRPFVGINCAALPRELLESELFGSVRGAYTGAHQDQPGLVEKADGGTLLLDEIPSMDLALQAKLLRFLDSGELRRVGDRRERVADVRVIAAANTDLTGCVEAGRFRSDLYFRLAGFPLRLPPLRERPEDVPALVEHFLAHEAARCRVEPPTLSAGALARLRAHPWPGNVRELHNLVTQIVLRFAGREVREDDLPLKPSDLEPASNGSDPALWRRGTFQELKQATVDRFERSYLEGLLRDHRGNVTRAAQAAGKHRRALTELLRRHRLDPALYRRRGRSKPRSVGQDAPTEMR